MAEQKKILIIEDDRYISKMYQLKLSLEGYEAEVRPKSGLALKHGISLVNTPGTIDSDYRGLVNLIMINHGKEPFTIHRGDRVAQMIIKEVVRAEIEVTEGLDDTVRSHGGFGHTGR